MGADDARASRHSGDMRSRVEPGAAGSPDWEAPRPRRSVPDQKSLQHPRIAEIGREVLCCCRIREVAGPMIREPDNWPNAVSGEVWQHGENFQAPLGNVIVPRRPRVTSLVWYAGIKVAQVDTRLKGWIFANT